MKQFFQSLKKDHAKVKGLEHHIKDQESKVFKSAEKALNLDEIQDIMKQFERKVENQKELEVTRGPVMGKPQLGQ